jgi:hypothetical protein
LKITVRESVAVSYFTFTMDSSTCRFYLCDGGDDSDRRLVNVDEYSNELSPAIDLPSRLENDSPGSNLQDLFRIAEYRTHDIDFDSPASDLCCGVIGDDCAGIRSGSHQS